MKKLILMLTALMAGSSIMAATIGEGTREISLSGSLNAETALGTDIAINLGYGVAVIDNVVVGGLLGLQNNDANTVYDIGAYGEYNFETMNQWMPYVGARLSFSGNDPDSDLVDGVDALVLKPYGGVKYFFSESVAAYAEAGWSLASDDLYVTDDLDAESTNYGILLGLRVYLP
jgi:predicted porin